MGYGMKHYFLPGLGHQVGLFIAEAREWGVKGPHKPSSEACADRHISKISLPQNHPEGAMLTPRIPDLAYLGWGLENVDFHGLPVGADAVGLWTTL